MLTASGALNIAFTTGIIARRACASTAQAILAAARAGAELAEAVGARGLARLRRSWDLKASVVWLADPEWAPSSALHRCRLPLQARIKP